MHRLSTRCHETLFNSPAPCPGCPVLGQTRATKQPAVLASAAGGHRVAIAEPLGDSRYRMLVVQLSDGLISALQRARLDQRARRAKLSVRELAVLDLLLLGRSAADMSRALGITERTARFHVANVLGKLGAETRSDLLRLLL
ncbi:MAG: helix-turn-helix transcriptional regulator [Myxococcales bacterium]|nr:helix-turn-helix transcriptional regulator [Myxococcales bacterium]